MRHIDWWMPLMHSEVLVQRTEEHDHRHASHIITGRWSRQIDRSPAA